MKTRTKRIISLILIVATLLLLSLSLVSCKGRYTYVEMTVKDYGTIILKLDSDAAPKTVENFVNLVNSGFYNGLTFHRIKKDFMIQGGDPKGNGTGGTDNKIYGEFSSNGFINPISHKRGVISMARSDEPNSASCQFFICNADSPHLDGDYAAFGYVIEGMDVVDAITEEGIKHTTGDVIRDKSKQPVITEIKVIDYQE